MSDRPKLSVVGKEAQAESPEMTEARANAVAAIQKPGSKFVLYVADGDAESLVYVGADVEMLMILEKRLDASVREALEL